jgi:hypothetical protein
MMANQHRLRIRRSARRLREILKNARDRYDGIAVIKPPKIRFEPEDELRNEQSAFLVAFDDLGAFRRILTARYEASARVGSGKQQPNRGKLHVSSALLPRALPALQGLFLAALPTGCGSQIS